MSTSLAPQPPAGAGKMLTKEQVSAIYRDLIASERLIQIAHDIDRTTTFVCHQNTYLVARFLKRLGHNCRWSSGYYCCKPPAPPVHHSWIEFNAEGKPAVICEFDPRQLFDRGGYKNDPMPSGEIADFEVRISPIAIIVATELVELPEDGDKSKFMVRSQEVLNRYVQNRTLTPDIDSKRLDDLAEESYACYRDLLEEFDSSEGD